MASRDQRLPTRLCVPITRAALRPDSIGIGGAVFKETRTFAKPQVRLRLAFSPSIPNHQCSSVSICGERGLEA